ncbi:MAG: RHS repeat-associated core domain-containing protein, partial [Thermoanaerobaculum sp.]
DASTGYDYMHARYYASVAGRFLSVDPGRDYDPKSPQSFNLYAYVRNNPVSAVDKDGRFWVPIVVGGAVGAVTHILTEKFGRGKSWAEATEIKGVLKATAVGMAAGVPGVGMFLGAAVKAAFVYGDLKSAGISHEKKLEKALSAGAVTFVGGAAAGLGASGLKPGTSAAAVAVAEGFIGAVVSGGIDAAEGLKQELQPLYERSSPQLKDKLDQLKELQKDPEFSPRLVKVTSETNPATGEEKK